MRGARPRALSAGHERIFGDHEFPKFQKNRPKLMPKTRSHKIPNFHWPKTHIEMELPELILARKSLLVKLFDWGMQHGPLKIFRVVEMFKQADTACDALLEVIITLRELVPPEVLRGPLVERSWGMQNPLCSTTGDKSSPKGTGKFPDTTTQLANDNVILEFVYAIHKMEAAVVTLTCRILQDNPPPNSRLAMKGLRRFSSIKNQAFCLKSETELVQKQAIFGEILAKAFKQNRMEFLGGILEGLMVITSKDERSIDYFDDNNMQLAGFGEDGMESTDPPKTSFFIDQNEFKFRKSPVKQEPGSQTPIGKKSSERDVKYFEHKLPLSSAVSLPISGINKRYREPESDTEDSDDGRLAEPKHHIFDENENSPVGDRVEDQVMKRLRIDVGAVQILGGEVEMGLVVKENEEVVKENEEAAKKNMGPLAQYMGHRARSEVEKEKEEPTTDGMK